MTVESAAPLSDPVRIERLGADGDGIATTATGRLYVERTCPGDLVRVDASLPVQGGRRATEFVVLAPMPRAADRCPHAERCGGCRLQHLPDADYAAFKRQRIVDELAREGFAGDLVQEPVLSPPFSRRRARLGFVRAGRRIVLGFRERHAETLVDVVACAVLRPELTALMAPLRELLASTEARRGEILLTATSTGIDALVRARPAPRPDDLERIGGFARERKLARIVWDDGSEPLPIATLEAPEIRFGPAVVRPPPGAFLQATAEGEAAIVAAVQEALPGAGPFADLYAGCGTLSLPLLERGPVRAFELDAASLDAARRGSAGRLHTERRDLDRSPLTVDELKPFRGLVLDPPYRGAAAQAATLARSTVPQLAYVSCNPRSFARDAAVLREGGYALLWVRPIDQFSWSAEVELVAALRQQA